MRDSDKLRVEPEQGEPPYVDHQADLVAEEKPADWADQSMWERASKAGPARPNPLFEPQTETISLSPQQAQRCLAAQLAANMLTAPGKPFQPGHYPSANEVMALAEWIMANPEAQPRYHTAMILPLHVLPGDRIDGGIIVEGPEPAERGDGVRLKVRQGDDHEISFVQPIDTPLSIIR